MQWRDGYIAVDWGTTNRRAFRVEPDGTVAAQFEDALGLMAVPPDGFAAAAAEIRTRLGDRPMLLAGMVGSNRGWLEAPYVPCPAALADLARAVRWVEPGRTGIVPGLAQPDPADVMRGEEVQVLGAIAAAMVPANVFVCHPGTHAKWISAAEGRIAAFQTMMTGEIYGLLSRHSILADQLAGAVEPGAAFDAGVAEALAGGDLLAGLFRIRARHLLERGGGDGASYASGLLIGYDVRAGLALSDAATIALIGRPDLCTLYAAAIDRAGRATTTVDGNAAFLAGIHAVTEML